MNIQPAAFFIFAGLAIVCSLAVVLKRNPVTNAFNLVMVFFAFAGIYAVMGAHLLAALQILVYAGAIMVLFIFVIMLLNADEPSFDLRRSHPVQKGFAAIFGAVLFALFVQAFRHAKAPAALGPFTPEAVEKAGGNSMVLSDLMFSKYVFPFELTSVLLLACTVGAVAIAKRKLRN